MPVPDLVDELRRFLQQQRIRQGGLLVAVSGGADSMAMLRGLQELATEQSLRLVAAHLNHQLRGEAAHADAVWLQAECVKLQVPLELKEENVSAQAAATGEGIEETARRLRYAFLQETARARNCRWVAVAHTADDQAETILHHIVRGTGLAGLQGIPAVRVLEPELSLLRPLLSVPRSGVEAYLRGLGQSYREDASNADVHYTRNRLRHRVLPVLREEFNPAVDAALCRLGQQAAEAQTALALLAQRRLAELLQPASDSSAQNSASLAWPSLAAEPAHFVREIFAQLWRLRQWPRQGMHARHWDQLAELTHSEKRVTLPGRLVARREGRLIVIAPTLEGGATPDSESSPPRSPERPQG